MAESIQPYTTARVDYLASYLQTLLPGLDKTVATTWIKSERGVSGNVLGTTYTSDGRQHLFTFSSQEAGLRSAASWINTHSRYSGVKASLGSSASAQASALATSGWNNSYYPGVFRSIISHTGSSSPSGGTSTPTTSVYAGGSSGGGTWTTATQDTLGKIGISTDPTHVLTESDIWKIAMKATGQDTTTSINPSNQIYQGYLANLKGKTVASMSADYQAGTTYQQPGFTLPIPDVQTAITFLAIILVGVAFLGLGGLIALRKKSD